MKIRKSIVALALAVLAAPAYAIDKTTDTAEAPKPAAAAPAIAKEARNAVRIVELPAGKMVVSPAAKDFGGFGGFGAWFTEQDKRRTDGFFRLTPRDFIFHLRGGGMQWGYVVDEVPADTGGFAVADFPGGLYVVAATVNDDREDNHRVHDAALEWIRKSGCFALDEMRGHRHMSRLASVPQSLERMAAAAGYGQLELYFPVRAKKETENND